MREAGEVLRVRRLEIERRLDAAARELGDIRQAKSDGTADDEHDPEGSTLTEDWSRLIGLRADAAAQLTTIDAALARVAAGTYGVCVGCGRDIPPARLEARPEAARCVACAAVNDR